MARTSRISPKSTPNWTPPRLAVRVPDAPGLACAARALLSKPARMRKMGRAGAERAANGAASLEIMAAIDPIRPRWPPNIDESSRRTCARLIFGERRLALSRGPWLPLGALRRGGARGLTRSAPARGLPTVAMGGLTLGGDGKAPTALGLGAILLERGGAALPSVVGHGRRTRSTAPFVVDRPATSAQCRRRSPVIGAHGKDDRRSTARRRRASHETLAPALILTTGCAAPDSFPDLPFSSSTRFRPLRMAFAARTAARSAGGAIGRRRPRHRDRREGQGISPTVDPHHFSARGSRANPSSRGAWRARAHSPSRGLASREIR